MTNVKYRAIKNSSWGIAIDIEGESIENVDIELIKEGFHIVNNFYLKMKANARFSDIEIDFIKHGLYLSLKDLYIENNTFITIYGVDFNPTDYQEEGLIAAFYQWSNLHFQLDNKNELEYTFNKELNKYIFNI